MNGQPVIHWFRQDLRLADNPALTAAAAAGRVLPVYILDDGQPQSHPAGAASRWWLHHSLVSLDRSLHGRLYVEAGDPGKILNQLARLYGIRKVFWNRCYEPWQIDRDKLIKISLGETDVEVVSYNGSLLWEPWEILKADRTAYKVFTPYYRRGCLAAPLPRQPIPKTDRITLIDPEQPDDKIHRLGLLPVINWDKQLQPHWVIGEHGATQQLDRFLQVGLADYSIGRDFPASRSVSRLSPCLHHGELSPNQAWYAARSVSDDHNVQHFCTELGWREFSYYLLFHFPDLPHSNWNTRFDNFPWREDPGLLRAWQQGRTGYPLVDAGMRELWQTGYMHNRVRMVVGSFLVKNLLQDWRDGERWFRDCLVDWDLASNTASWQWIAGCGADAAPYFRIFNPVSQGHKFDPGGEYTRRFVPELSRLPDKYLFSPWQAPEPVLREAGVRLGVDYPAPVVDLKVSRSAALDAYAATRG